MTEIELLTQQIAEMTPLVKQHTDTLFLLFLSAVTGIFVGLFFAVGAIGTWAGRPFGIGLAGIGMIFLVFFIFHTQDDDSPVLIRAEMMKERSDLIKSNIKMMNCEELRLNILSIMEDDETPDYHKEHFDFEKDYYYHKCEIPLREEVIKLREQ